MKINKPIFYRNLIIITLAVINLTAFQQNNLTQPVQKVKIVRAYTKDALSKQDIKEMFLKIANEELASNVISNDIKNKRLVIK